MQRNPNARQTADGNASDSILEADRARAGRPRGLTRAGKGRPKGSPNRTTVAAKAAILATYDAIGGADAFAAWARKNRTAFYAHFAKLLPHEVSGELAGRLIIEVVDEVVDE